MKVQFAENYIRYRLTQGEFGELQKGERVTLTINNIFMAKLYKDKTMKQAYKFEKNDKGTVLALSAFLVEEIPCDAKNGLVLQEKDICISVAIDFKNRN